MKKHFLLIDGLLTITLVLLVWIVIKLNSFDYRINQIGLMLAEQKIMNIPRQIVDVEIDEGDSFTMGDSIAPVSVIMFFDYECGYCKLFFDRTFPQIDEQLIQTGQLRFVFRHFPIEMHPQAYVAAQMAEQARQQGKFLEMHSKLMETYNLHEGALVVYAEDLNVDTANWQSNPESIEKIDGDKAAGVGIFVRGTPSFIINGKMYAGMRDFDEFKQIAEIR